MMSSDATPPWRSRARQKVLRWLQEACSAQGCSQPLPLERRLTAARYGPQVHARTRQPPCTSARPERKWKGQNPQRAGYPCRWERHGTSTKGSLASDLHTAPTMASSATSCSMTTTMKRSSLQARRVCSSLTSVQDAPGVAVFHKLQQRPSNNGGITLRKETPAQGGCPSVNMTRRRGTKQEARVAADEGCTRDAVSSGATHVPSSCAPIDNEIKQLAAHSRLHNYVNKTAVFIHLHISYRLIDCMHASLVAHCIRGNRPMLVILLLHARHAARIAAASHLT